MLESSEDELKDLPYDSDGEDKLQNRRSLSSSSLRNKSSRSSRSKVCNQGEICEIFGDSIWLQHLELIF